MPTFSFKIVPNKKKERSSAKQTVSYDVLSKDVSGVIYITPEFTYYCYIKGKLYSLTTNSFNCKGKRRIYAQFLDNYNQRICIIRTPDFKPECNRLYFLPFAAGSLVNGDIVFNKLTKEIQFRFRKVIIEYMHPRAHEALELWRDNKEALASRRLDCITKFYDEST